MKVLLLIFTIVSLFSCSSQENPLSSSSNSQRNEELKELILKNKAKWDSLNIKSYRFSLRKTSTLFRFPQLNYVSDKKIDSVFRSDYYIANNTPLVGLRMDVSEGITVDELFEIMLNTVDGEYYQFSKEESDTSFPEFDSTYFYPSKFYIDYHKTINEQEVGKEAPIYRSIFFFDDSLASNKLDSLPQDTIVGESDVKIYSSIDSAPLTQSEQDFLKQGIKNDQEYIDLKVIEINEEIFNKEQIIVEIDEKKWVKNRSDMETNVNKWKNTDADNWMNKDKDNLPLEIILENNAYSGSVRINNHYYDIKNIKNDIHIACIKVILED